jgi:hypothetical protein
MILVLLLLLHLGLGLRFACIILALVLLPLHHVVDSGRIRAETNSVHCVPGVGRSNNGPRPNHDARLHVDRIKEWRKEGSRGPDLKPQTADQTFQADRTGWTAGTARAQWLGAGDLDGRGPIAAVAIRLSRSSKLGAEAKKMGVDSTCRKE